MKDTEITTENLQWYLGQPMDIQLSLFRNYLEMAKILANQLLDDEVRNKAGEKHSHEKPEAGKYSRWGSNPGSIMIGEEKVKIKVPRLHDNNTEKTESPENYQKIRKSKLPSEELMKKILVGLSEHDYEDVVKMGVESFGLSQSTVSRAFIEQSSKILEEFEQRDLSLYDFVALAIDGKYLSKENMVIALGVTISGEKIPIGFIQTTTENSEAIKGLFRDLIKRGFRFSEGLLTIVDGARGLSKAIRETFGEFALIQRCQWHKREDVVGYLNETDKEKYRDKLQRAYNEPVYEIAKSEIYKIVNELNKINCTAANSLQEGLEETLTIQRLGLFTELGRSFTTTNIIENLNSQLEKYLGRIKYWINSNMRHRWVAGALLEIERKMRRINNYDKLHLLRKALKTELKLEQIRVA